MIRKRGRECERRDFPYASIACGVLIAGGITCGQVHNHPGRDFQPARPRTSLEGPQPDRRPEALPSIAMIQLGDSNAGM